MPSIHKGLHNCGCVDVRLTKSERDAMNLAAIDAAVTIREFIRTRVGLPQYIHVRNGHVVVVSDESIADLCIKVSAAPALARTTH